MSLLLTILLISSGLVASIFLISISIWCWKNKKKYKDKHPEVKATFFKLKDDDEHSHYGFDEYK